jgi:magnesium-transporting ATPase (P-type)
LVVTILLVLCAFVMLVFIAVEKSATFQEGMQLYVTIIIAVIPEGLLVSITISLSMTTRRLAKKQIMITTPHQIEALAETSCLCIPL